jgi:DNA-binding response OmpR family regulator
MTNKKNKSILVVEDDISMAKVLKNKLSSEGYDVAQAKNGEEGLETALKEHPDLILLDIVMPVMDGITMLHELRKDAWGKNVKVLILTNLSDAKKEKEALEDGLCDYLIKTNWQLDDVVKKIDENINPS